MSKTNSAVHLIPLPKSLFSVQDVADQYDGFILDLWGVLHDGTKALPGVPAALSWLKSKGKVIYLLSNAPRRCSAVIDKMSGFGISPALYDHVMTSGEMTRQMLMPGTDMKFSFADKFYHLGPERDRNLFDDWQQNEVDDLAKATFILNTGPLDFDHGIDHYHPIMSQALDHGLPMVCANPDTEVLIAERRVMCAGAMARWYQQQGGETHIFGKPHMHVYRRCLSDMKEISSARILAVGDNLSTDIAGANKAGIDSCFITSGIHAKALGARDGQMPDQTDLLDVMRLYGQPCAYVMSMFGFKPVS